VTTEKSNDAVGHSTGFDVVVLAGSAGGLRAVLTTVEQLPPQFPAAIVVSLHRAADSHRRDTLPELLGRRASMPVQTAGNPVTLTPGRIIVMPPQTELTAGPDSSTLALAASESWRVADTTMTALAAHYGARCIGVVLSGRLDDAAQGARAIKRARGRVIVQDPADAHTPSMPAAALATGSVDLVVPARRIAPSLVALAMAPGGADLLRTPRPAWAG
jgi:two-component system, chemotaxis family, protein-glutamate methylesterase/glutaminase